MVPLENRMQIVLKDVSDRSSDTLPVLIRFNGSGINISPQGYSDFDSPAGSGAPIYLEFYEGHLRLIVWSDINAQEPSHIIDLERAREEFRIEAPLLGKN